MTKNGFYDSNKPFFCDLIVTETCMLNCRMCRMWQSKNDAKDIPVVFWQRFIDSLAEFLHGASAQIQLVGGEPLMKAETISLIRHAGSKGLATTMTTNGYLVDEKMASEIVVSGLNTLVFSLDGIKSQTHDFLRGKPGVFDKTVAAIYLISKYRKNTPRINIVTTIMGPNLNELTELAQWANKEKIIENISFQAVMQPFFTNPDDQWYAKEEFGFLWPKDLAKIAEVLAAIKQLKKEGCRITNPAGQFDVFRAYFEYPEKFVKVLKCNLGYNAISVNTSGKIFLCMATEPIGDIREDRSVKEMWFSEKAEQVRRDIQSCKRNCKSMINCFFEEELDTATKG